MKKTTKILIIYAICLSVIFSIPVNEIRGVPGGYGDMNVEYDCSSSCHNSISGATQSAGSITMSTNNSNPEAGTALAVNVTVSNTEQESGESIGLMLVSVLEFSKSQPADNGWTIISDPHGGSKNFVQDPADDSGSATFSWLIKAPLIPGTYSLHVREHHGNGANTPFFNDHSAGLTFDVFSLIKFTSTKLNISLPDEILQDRTTTFGVTLYDIDDNSISNELVEVFTPTIYGLLKIGENLTDSNGSFTFDHKFQYSGEIRIIAIYKGGTELNASNSSISINVRSTWEPEDHGVGPLPATILIGTVLGGIWSIFGIVFYMLYRVHNSFKRVNEFIQPKDAQEEKKSQ